MMNIAWNKPNITQHIRGKSSCFLSSSCVPRNDNIVTLRYAVIRKPAKLISIIVTHPSSLLLSASVDVDVLNPSLTGPGHIFYSLRLESL